MSDSYIIRKMTASPRSTLKQHSRKKKDTSKPETWKTVKKLDSLQGREVCKIMELMLKEMGLRVDRSTHGNIRIVSQLTQEQEDILLGDDN